MNRISVSIVRNGTQSIFTNHKAPCNDSHQRGNLPVWILSETVFVCLCLFLFLFCFVFFFFYGGLTRRVIWTHTKEKHNQCIVRNIFFSLQINLSVTWRHTSGETTPVWGLSETFFYGGLICRDTPELTHTKEKPYQCDYCHKMFFTAISPPETHQNSHQRETIPMWVLSEVFSSSTQSTVRQSSLNVLIRTHTKEKPYQCEIYHYQKGFTQRSYMSYISDVTWGLVQRRNWASVNTI